MVAAPCSWLKVEDDDALDTALALTCDRVSALQLADDVAIEIVPNPEIDRHRVLRTEM
jgi:hypothetical protein